MASGPRACNPSRFQEIGGLVCGKGGLGLEQHPALGVHSSQSLPCWGPLACPDSLPPRLQGRGLRRPVGVGSTPNLYAPKAVSDVRSGRSAGLWSSVNS